MKVIREKAVDRKKSTLRLREDIRVRLHEKADEAGLSFNELVEAMLEQDLNDKKYVLRIRSE